MVIHGNAAKSRDITMSCRLLFLSFRFVQNDSDWPNSDFAIMALPTTVD